MYIYIYIYIHGPAHDADHIADYHGRDNENYKVDEDDQYNKPCYHGDHNSPGTFPKELSTASIAPGGAARHARPGTFFPHQPLYAVTGSTQTEHF